MIQSYGICRDIKFPGKTVHQEELAEFARMKKILVVQGIVTLCIVCGDPVADFHHNEGRLRSPDRVADPTIIYPVCRKCHKKFQVGWFDCGVFHQLTIHDEMVYDNDEPVKDIRRLHAEFIRLWKENQ